MFDSLHYGYNYLQMVVCQYSKYATNNAMVYLFGSALWEENFIQNYTFNPTHLTFKKEWGWGMFYSHVRSYTSLHYYPWESLYLL